jgi:CheY-like chemotaxis protein
VPRTSPERQAQVESRPPDFDIGLPGIDGYEVARRLRAESQDAERILIALSGYGQERDRERSRSAGIRVHLTKPFDLASLERLIQELLGP